jgi:hypothetical protein
MSVRSIRTLPCWNRIVKVTVTKVINGKPADLIHRGRMTEPLGIPSSASFWDSNFNREGSHIPIGLLQSGLWRKMPHRKVTIHYAGH